jgi:IS30 family transposase
MDNIHDAFCPNKDCQDNGLRNYGNIAIRGKYGKDKTKDLLYCRTCNKRFAATRSTAFFGLHLSDERIAQIIHHTAKGDSVRTTARLLNMNKSTVYRVIQRASQHCETVLSNLLHALRLEEAQLDELWAFVKKRKLLTNKKAE